MRNRPVPSIAAMLLSAACAVASAQSAGTAGEPVVDPKVERRDVRVPKFPSKDFEIGVFGGVYGTQSFGSSGVAGLRLGYHITEDFFVESAFGSTKVSDKTFEEIFPGAGPLADTDRKLNYYNLSAGYNVLPGEVFIGSRHAKASSLYLIAGVGSTKFANQKRQTMNVGFGFRVLLSDRFAIRLDVRDHIFSYDLLGVRQNSQNLELTTGLSFYF